MNTTSTYELAYRLLSGPDVPVGIPDMRSDAPESQFREPVIEYQKGSVESTGQDIDVAILTWIR